MLTRLSEIIGDRMQMPQRFQEARMPDVPMISLSEQAEQVRTLFADYLKKENTSREAHRAAMSAAYRFCRLVVDDQKSFEALAEAAKVKKARKDANRLVRPIQYVFGRNTRSGSWEGISASQAGKIATMLDYALFQEVSVEDLDTWLKGKSQEDRLDEARNDKDYQRLLDKPTPPADNRLEEGIRKARTDWSTIAVDPGVKISVSKDAGLKPGRVELLGELDDEGFLTLLGILERDPEAVEKAIKRLVSPQSGPKVRKAFDSFVDVIRLSALVPNNKASALIRNGPDGLSIWVGMLDSRSTPAARIFSPAPDENMPFGEFILGPDEIKALSFLRRTVKFDNAQYGTVKSRQVIRFSFAKTLDEWVRAYDAKRIELARKRAAKATQLGKTAPKEPASFTFPKAINKEKGSVYVFLPPVSANSAGSITVISEQMTKGHPEFDLTKNNRIALKTLAADLQAEDVATLVMSVHHRHLCLRDPAKPDAETAVQIELPEPFRSDVRCSVRSNDIKILLNALTSFGTGKGKLVLSSYGVFTTINSKDYTWDVFVPTIVGDVFDGRGCKLMPLVSQPLQGVAAE